LLETERLVLRKPQLEDANDLLEYVGDPEVMRWIGGETGDLAATVATIERWLARWDENGIGTFSVLHEGRVVGRVGFLIWDADSWDISSYAAAVEPVTELRLDDRPQALGQRLRDRSRASPAAVGLRAGRRVADLTDQSGQRALDPRRREAGRSPNGHGRGGRQPSRHLAASTATFLTFQ
jgi:hypothetical protein